MTIAAFYNEVKHLGNLFGAKGVFYGPKGHLGVDWNRHPAGVLVPSWTPGTVVVATFYRNLGWTVIVRRPDGRFAGFCHMLERPAVKVGQSVLPGTIVGKVGNTGLFSLGAHLHCTLEPSIAIGTANAIDPLPFIRAAVRAANPRRSTMSTLFYTKKDGKNLFALAGDAPGTSANWLETQDQNLANALAAVHGNAVQLSPATFQSWKDRYLEGLPVVGGSAPVQPSAPKVFEGKITLEEQA